MTTVVEVQPTLIEGGTSFTCVSPITLRPIVATPMLNEPEAPAFTVQELKDSLERASRTITSPGS